MAIEHRERGIEGQETGWRYPRRSRLLRGDFLAAMCFISPWIIGFAWFQLYPIGASFYYSFTSYNMMQPPRFVGMENYTRLFTEDDLFRKSLRNTAVYTLFSVPLGLFVAFTFALLLNREIPGRALFRAIFYFPAVVPSVATAILWIMLLNTQGGLVNAFLGVFGISPVPWLTSPDWTMPSLILLSLWGVGPSVVIFLAGLQGVSRELEQSMALPVLRSASLFESVSICRRAGERWWLAWMRLAEAYRASILEDPAALESAVREALDLARQVPDAHACVTALADFALRAEGADARRATFLLGICEQYWRDAGGFMLAVEPWATAINQARERCRTALGEAAYEEEHRRGEASTLEESIAVVLGERPSAPSSTGSGRHGHRGEVDQARGRDRPPGRREAQQPRHRSPACPVFSHGRDPCAEHPHQDRFHQPDADSGLVRRA